MDPIAEYIKGFVSTKNDALARVEKEEALRDCIQPNIGEEVGRFLALLIRATKAKRALELGTSLGYSTVWLGRALSATGGKLISVEKDERNHASAEKSIRAAGLSEVVELILGDAGDVLDQLEGPFDLILQDSDKALYPKLLERCVKLTRDGGVIVADDALFKPMGVSEKFSVPVHKYNELVFADKRLYSTIIPIGDGITVSVKLGDGSPK